eukprot:SM000194S04830  [mRNA]  locus=s194:143834:148103:- [translate_table: standard]
MPALWRYFPPPYAPKRRHPLLLLSGIATNAVGYDIDPELSFARYMAEQGFETWILEVRGAGFSKLVDGPPPQTPDELVASDADGAAATNGATGGGRAVDRQEQLMATVEQLREQLAGLLEERKRLEMGQRAAELRRSLARLLQQAQQTALVGRVNELASKLSSLLDGTQKTAIGLQIGNVRDGLAKLLEDAQRTSLAGPIKDLSDRLTSVLDDAPMGARVAEVRQSITRLLEDGQRMALSNRITELVERLTTLLEGSEKTALTTRIDDLRQRLAGLQSHGQRLVEGSSVLASPRFEELRSRITSIMGETQKTFALIQKTDWDFDSYLKEDLPAAMQYIQRICSPPDGKLLSVGHSMGGILLYAHVSTKGTDSGIAAYVTVASSLDYDVSDTSLKLLLPFASPAELLSVPVVPLGILARAALPFIMRPPYTLAWFGFHVSASRMMDPPIFRKLWTQHFCTIPMRLLLQMATVFQPGGLRDRSGSIKYRDGLGKAAVPVLAVSGDKDLICPPIAVTDTTEHIRSDMLTYKHFGGLGGRHYSHYDLICGKWARTEVYPVIRQFLLHHDSIETADTSS